MRPRFRRFRRFKGEGIAASGDEYKISVTGSCFVSLVLHDGVQEPPSLGRSPAEDF